ncbi:MAG: hypothetical protein H0W18_02775 [Acidobacteria bacterium]|nr:hypothetical protein [Acidobacteriota bacterium]
MEQRRLRLGDILDDYCPRERRVTNHAVVAMIEENVKQTRCTTCDAEHPYKGGREPRRRKTPATSALYREVLADMPEVPTPPPAPVAAAPDTDRSLAASAEVETAEAPVVTATDEELPADEIADEPREEGPVHRPLIRATLPRPEGQKEVRQVTDFTIRHNAGRGGQFRGDRSQRAAGGANGNGNGNRPHGRRFSAGSPPGMPGRGSSGRGGGGGFRGPGPGQGQGQGQGPPRYGGKKRSR